MFLGSNIMWPYDLDHWFWRRKLSFIHLTQIPILSILWLSISALLMITFPSHGTVTAHAQYHATYALGVTQNRTWQFFDPELSIHNTTCIGLRWRLRVVHTWASPHVKVVFGRKKTDQKKSLNLLYWEEDTTIPCRVGWMLVVIFYTRNK